MKDLKIEVKYMIISDLKEMLGILIKELEKAKKIESNIGGKLTATYNKNSELSN